MPYGNIFGGTDPIYTVLNSNFMQLWGKQNLWYTPLVSIQKWDSFHQSRKMRILATPLKYSGTGIHTLKYFEDYNFRLTQRLGKIAILRQPPSWLSIPLPRKTGFSTSQHSNPVVRDEQNELTYSFIVLRKYKPDKVTKQRERLFYDRSVDTGVDKRNCMVKN